MKKIIFAALVLVLVAFGAAHAQQRVNINRAELTWEWSPGTGVDDGGMVEMFIVYCGPVPGQYSRTFVVADPKARSVPVKDAIGGNGQWYCALAAANQFGESGKTNEIFFVAGVAPSSAKSLSLRQK